MNMSSNTDSSNYDLFKFLDERIVGQGQPHTHTSMYNPRASYFIKDVDMDEFYELYEKEFFNSTELHITEHKDKDINPLIIDLDFKYEIETFERKHTDEHIKRIIELYINEIVNLFNIDRNDTRLVSFVFQRDNIYKIKGVTKDGIHILFPFIISNSNSFYYIRDNILKKIGAIISNLGFKNVISDVVDRSVISPNTLWLLYGSNKEKPKGDPYKLSDIYDGNANKVGLTDYFDFENKPINLVRFFSVRGKKDSDSIPIREDKLSLFDATTIKKKASKKVPISYDYDEIKELVSMLSEERSDNYSQWLDVGWALHNIDPNSQELLELWIEFSKKSSKFEEGVCEKEWDKSRNEGLNKGTLYHWVKIDNYQAFMELKRKNISPFIDKAINNQTNYDVAYVLFKLRENDFVYSDNEWYMYKNHKWNRELNGTALRQLISTDLCKLFAQKISDNNVLYSSSNITEEEKEEIKLKNKTIVSLTLKLKTTSYKDNLMKECKEMFTNNDFIKKLDSNPFLLGFTNGVYDLKKGELRDGRPEDYIQMNTDIEKIDFDDTNEHWPDLKRFLETVFYEEEIHDYFLLYLSSCLQGHNAEEKFRVWNGRGCHAYDTDIMMFNGTIKKVQNIIEGDKLMGDDSTERNVIDLKRGYSDMFEITMNLLKNSESYEKFTVNGDHILCLKVIKDNVLNDNIIEIKVRDYLNISNKDEKYVLYKVGLDFESKEIPLDPYMIGSSLCNENNKSIPNIYKYNSKDIRLKVLSGIIDSSNNEKNNNQYKVTIKNESLMDDIIYLVRSLGLSIIKDKNCSSNIIIYDEGIENNLCYDFTIKQVNDDNFYGFELDGNHRYLMGDFTVTHNSNGKSKLLELFVHSIGQYAIKFPVTMLTGKRAQSNACTPELVRSKGCRFGYLEEPGENERIEVGFLKELTGGDKITARGLHKEPIDFKPQFKLALLCNEIPKVPPNDSGTWRRMEVIEFKSHFVENPKDPGEFPIDKQLSEKMKNWKEMFMALLLDVYYAKYKLNGLRVPEEITKFTTEFQKTCDLYIDFIIENIEETKENTDSIDITQFYDEFKIWYEDSFSNNKYPTKTEFKKYLKKKYSKRISQTDVKGFKFRIKYDKQGNIISPSYMVGKKIPLNEMKPENLVDTNKDTEPDNKQNTKEDNIILPNTKSPDKIILEQIISNNNNIIQINNKTVVKLENPISDTELTNDVDEEILIEQIPTEQIIQDVQTMSGY
jgi:P4 family phage/plasmid primase-like protien